MSTITAPALPMLPVGPATSPKPHMVQAAKASRLLVPCQPDGAIARTIEQGDECRALGDFENAWTCYTLALRQWLRLQFMAVSGRSDCESQDEYSLAGKLRSLLAIDAWTYKLIQLILHRPTPASWLNVDLTAGIVKAIFNVER